jgi:hypothetical protein
MSNTMQSESKNETQQVVNQNNSGRFEKVMYMYSDNTGFFGDHALRKQGRNALYDDNLISIEFLRERAARGSGVPHGEYPYVFWGGAVYNWDEATQGYVFIGEIVKRNRRQSVFIREDMSVVAKDGRTIQLYHDQQYKMLVEIMTLNDDTAHKMSYVLQGEGTDPFEIDFDPKNHYVHIEDYVIISTIYEAAVREDRGRDPDCPF